MLTKKRYSISNMVVWTRLETGIFILFAALVTFLYDVVGLTFLNLPWIPIALVGTAVAFILGFQNNSAYGRIWEARKIWGGIVNASRSWGMKVKDMVTNEYCNEPVQEQRLKEHIRVLVYRHIAWLTALRHNMREKRPWENVDKDRTNREWIEKLHIQERIFSLEEELLPYLSKEEHAYVLSKKNKQAALLYLQSSHLRALKEMGLIWEFSFLELQNLLQEFFELQGKSERIKNFPYPRQYATLSHLFVRIFIILLPFGLVPEFAQIGELFSTDFPLIAPFFIWLAVPFCAIVSWVFYTMERIGRVGENPFEGSPNDVPISTIARGIEIDLRQLLNEEEAQIPKQFPEIYNVQM